VELFQKVPKMQKRSRRREGPNRDLFVVLRV